MVLFEDIIKSEGISSAHILGTFNKGKFELEKAGYHIPSLEENACLRMQEGKDSQISKNKNLVREGVLYLSHKEKFLVKISPIMFNPIEATRVHKERSEFYLGDKEIEIFLKGSLKIPEDHFFIPTKRFGEEEITVYAFGNYAQDYGNFLKDAKIEKMPMWISANSIIERPFARQIYFMGLYSNSSINSNSEVSSELSVIRGVKGNNLAKKLK